MLAIVQPTGVQGNHQVVNATINVFGYILRITDTHVHITQDITDPYGHRQKQPGAVESHRRDTALVVAE